MSQEHIPGAQGPAQHSHGARIPRSLRPRLLVPVLAVLALILTSVLVWPVATRHAGAAAAPASMVVDPSSGPAGTQTELSGLNFPREADLTDNVSSFTFDGAPITSPAIVACSNSGFGFGLACNGNSPYPFTIPAGAQPGDHTFRLVIRTNNPTVQTITLVDVSATFTVVANDTATLTPSVTTTASPTATGTPAVTDTATSTATASATGTATSTPVPNAPTATITNTPLPNVPTATNTNTPLPKAPTATVTATPQKINAPFVVLVRTEFGRGLVAVALHTAPAAKIKLEFAITNKPNGGKTVFDLKQGGVTNALGVLTFRLKVSYSWHPSDRGMLTVNETSNGNTQTVKRQYRFQMS
jgi:hypothetical protein